MKSIDLDKILSLRNHTRMFLVHTIQQIAMCKFQPFSLFHSRVFELLTSVLFFFHFSRKKDKFWCTSPPKKEVMKLETCRIYFALRFCFISSNSKFDFKLWHHFLVTEWASSILLGLGSTPGKDRPTKPRLIYL